LFALDLLNPALALLHKTNAIAEEKSAKRNMMSGMKAKQHVEYVKSAARRGDTRKRLEEGFNKSQAS
jgi:hypothetical protein